MKGCLLILLISLSSFSRELKLDTVLDSAIRHYPEVLEAIQARESAKQKTIKALGEFDAILKLQGDKRLEGFYDGQYADVAIVKPLRAMNSRVYVGHRVSKGNYPSYEGELDTLSDGENRAGISFSLLRDRAIDPKRLKLRNGKLKVEELDLEVFQKRLEVQRQAFIAYWQWVAKGQVYRIKKELYDLAIKRTGAIEKKVKSGALARIYEVENRQYLVQRKSDVVQAEQELESAALKLSLYHRDSEGGPIIVGPERLPAKMEEGPILSEKKVEKDIQRTVRASPVLKSFKPKIEKWQNLGLIGDNRLTPRLDIKFEVSEDHGSGPDNLRGEEQKLFLAVEIPLQRNLGKATVAMARSEQLALEYKKRLAKEKLVAGIRSYALQINALEKIGENLKLEIKLAKQMEKAETQKFQSGGSDYFLVNIREKKTASAKEKLVKTELMKKIAMAAYKEVTLGFGPVP